MNLIGRELSRRYQELGLAGHGLSKDFGVSLLTPRFETSRHIIGLVFSEGERSPCLVTKIPRRPGDNEGVRREAEMLNALQGFATERVAGVPEIVGLFDVAGHDMLIETALPGDPLDPDHVVANFAGSLGAGVEFISALPGTRLPAENTDWYQTQITEPLDRLVQVAPMGGRMAELVARTHRYLGSIAGQTLPAVFEHADFSHPNLLITTSGRIQVADWERSTRFGVPAHDLVFYLQYLSESRRSAFARPDQLAAFDAAFVGVDAWSVPIGRDYLESRGVPPDLWPALVVAAWARSTSTLASRLVPEVDADRIPDGLNAAAISLTVQRDRDFCLWEHALARGSVLSKIPTDRV